MQCTAKAKSTGEQCRRRAVTGYRVCQVHGAGSARKGRSGGRPIKHGRSSHRYQSLVSSDRAERFRRAMEDPELLSLVPRIAALDSRFQELWERLGSKESGAAWKRLKTLSKEADQVQIDSQMDPAEKHRVFTDLWNRIMKTIEQGLDEYHEWTELREIIEDTRRLIESEAKRVKTIAEIVTMEEAKIFVERVMTHARKHLDSKEFTSLVYDLEQDLVQSFSDQGD